MYYVSKRKSKSIDLLFVFVYAGHNIVLQHSCKHHFEHCENIVVREAGTKMKLLSANSVVLCTNGVLLRNSYAEMEGLRTLRGLRKQSGELHIITHSVYKISAKMLYKTSF